MSDTTLPLAGAVDGMRMLKDGTMAVTLHFQPADRATVMAMMGEPGASIACVRLKDGHDAKSPAPAARTWADKGVMEKEAIELCKNPRFQQWVQYTRGIMAGEQECRQVVLTTCNVERRRELDTAEGARELFIAHVRKPFHQWLDRQPR